MTVKMERSNNIKFLLFRLFCKSSKITSVWRPSANFYFTRTRAKVSADALSSIAPRFQQSDMHPACERLKVPAGNLSKNFSPIFLPPKDTPHELADTEGWPELARRSRE